VSPLFVSNEYIALLLSIAIVYNAAVFALKVKVRRLDPTARRFYLQWRDFAIVRRALKSARAPEEERLHRRLLVAMHLIVAAVPLVIVVIVLLIG